jgi:hypothetical protein
VRNDMVIGEVPRLNAAPLPGGPAIVDGDRRVTRQERDDRVTRLVGALALHASSAGLAGASA